MEKESPKDEMYGSKEDYQNALSSIFVVMKERDYNPSLDILQTAIGVVKEAYLLAGLKDESRNVRLRLLELFVKKDQKESQDDWENELRWRSRRALSKIFETSEDRVALLHIAQSKESDVLYREAAEKILNGTYYEEAKKK